MKSKIFKKLIAGAATLAMVAQFGFVLPASAEELYKQDFEGVTDATKVFSAQNTAALSIASDATHGNYLSYDFTTAGGNSRGGEMDFAPSVAGKDYYVVEFDAALKKGNNQATEFVVKTSERAYYSANVNYGVEKGYLFKMSTTASDTWTLNDTTKATVNITAEEWNHYKLIIDTQKKLTSATITNDSGETVLDKQILGINGSATDIAGIYTLAGRYNPVILIDNIVVRDKEESDEFGELAPETLSSISLTSQINKVINQPAQDSPEHIPVTVKALGNYGTDITNDVTIEWSTTGLDNEDGYISLTKEPGTELGTVGDAPDGATAYFNVRNGVSNWFGNVTAKVTYGEDVLTISTPFAVIGASGSGANIAPATGYPENMSGYDDALVGYTATANGITDRDIVLNNWSIYGSNGARTLKLLKDDDGTKYLQFHNNGGGGSTVAVYQLADQANQYIVDMKVRFAGGAMSFGHYFNTPNNGENKPNWTASYGSGALTVGTQSISGLSSENWYRIVVSADESAKTCWIKVYDEDGTLKGSIDGEPLLATASEVQKYFCFQGTYPVDLASFRIYYPTASAIVLDGAETIQVPEKGAAAVTEAYSANVTDTDGFKMTGAVKWSLDEEYAGVTLNENTGAITVTDEAGSGTIVLIASYGSTRKEKEIRLSTTGNSISFTKSNSSITIPFAGESTVKAEYAAEARNKEGNKIEGSTVTYKLVDATGNVVENLKGVTFNPATGVLTVAPGAASKIVYVKAESTVTTAGETENLSARAKVNIHGLSFAFGTDDPTDDSYTKVTSADAYSDKVGYGFADTSVVTDEASDVKGTAAFKFEAKVPNGNYVVAVSATGADTITSEVVDTVTAVTGISKSGSQFNVAVCDGILDLTFPADAALKTLTITQAAQKEALTKPALYAIGDSTTNNTGNGAKSWGNCVGSGVTVPDVFSGFSNNGMAGRDSVNFYNQGRVEAVLLSVCPGDYVTVNMGINSKETGEGAAYETLLSQYYVDGIIQRGGIPVIVTATPIGFSDKSYPYDDATGQFDVDRGDGARNDVLRRIAAEKNLNIIELGQHFEDVFNAYTADDVTAYNADQGTSHATVLDMVKSWYVDHNHYYEYLGNMIAEYILGEVEFIAENPFKVTSVAKTVSDTNVVLTATVAEDATKGSETFNVFVAQYNPDGTLIGVEKSTVTFSSAENGLTATVDYTPNPAAADTKIFVWDNNMVPYTTDTVAVPAVG